MNEGLPTPGSSHYIQNGTTVQSASMAITGAVLTQQAVSIEAATSAESATPLLQVTNTTESPAWNQQSLLLVDSAVGFVAQGTWGTGALPASGPGERLMWSPRHAAFREGSTDTHWDAENIGLQSWAGGNSTTASGVASFAFGDHSVASARGAVALGDSSEASGVASLAAGSSTTASGFASLAVGQEAVASGASAVALGAYVVAGANSTAMGNRAQSGSFTGSFVWGDNSTTSVASNTANNQPSQVVDERGHFARRVAAHCGVIAAEARPG